MLQSPPATFAGSVIPGVPPPWDAADGTPWRGSPSPHRQTGLQMTPPGSPARCLSKCRPFVFSGAFIILRKIRFGHFSLTTSVSNLVTKGKFSPSSHNYFLTLSPLFHLLNYVELFSLLFSKNASSVQCRNIYYLLSLDLLTFSLFRREKKMDQL